MKALINLWKHHGTKLLGFAQVTMGAIAVYAEGHWGKYVLIASGLLTAWRGFINSQQQEKTS